MSSILIDEFKKKQKSEVKNCNKKTETIQTEYQGNTSKIINKFNKIQIKEEIFLKAKANSISINKSNKETGIGMNHNIEVLTSKISISNRQKDLEIKNDSITVIPNS